MQPFVKRGIWTLVIGVGILIVGLVYRRYTGEQNLIALLNGDPTPKIMSIEIENQQRRLICTDREVLQYLEEIILRRPEEYAGVGRYSYSGDFAFAGGGRYKTYLSVNTNGFAISIDALASEEGLMTHEVLLTAPMPEKVKQLFEFLDEPIAKAAGTILIMENGRQPTRQYDPSLVRR